MPRGSVKLSLTPLQARVACEGLEHLSGYTSEELTEHLEWGSREQRAWAAVLGLLTVAQERAS